MNKITIITGPQGSGKTRLAEKMVEGKVSITLDSYDYLEHYATRQRIRRAI